MEPNKKKRDKTGDQGAPLDSKKSAAPKNLADLVFGWTKGVTCIVLLFFSFIAEIVLDDCTKA